MCRARFLLDPYIAEPRDLHSLRLHVEIDSVRDPNRLWKSRFDPYPILAVKNVGYSQAFTRKSFELLREAHFGKLFPQAVVSYVSLREESGFGGSKDTLGVGERCGGDKPGCSWFARSILRNRNWTQALEGIYTV